jgi:flagellar biosynthesis GTPase FlhF
LYFCIFFAEEQPPQRKKLELKPRTLEPSEQPLSPTASSEGRSPSLTPSSSKPKSNPFGDARPRDDAEIQKKLEERQKQKEEAKKAAEEAERKAKEEAARQAKEEEERKKREEEERAKAAKEAEEREREAAKNNRGGSAQTGGKGGRFGGKSEEKEVGRTDVGSWRRDTPISRPPPSQTSRGGYSGQNRHSKEGSGSRIDRNNQERPQRENRTSSAPKTPILEPPKKIEQRNPYSLLEQVSYLCQVFFYCH